MKRTSIFYLLIIWLCLAGSSCRQKQTITSLLVEAETLMYEHPDSALRLLETIQHPEWLTGQTQADYALLLTQARSRNLIPATSDSLIRIAVDYYRNSDQKEQKVKALLHLGDVYLDMGRYAEAALPLMQAEEWADGLEDPYVKYLIHIDLGYLNRKGKNYNSALDHYKTALQTNLSHEYTGWRTNDSGTTLKLSREEFVDSVCACLHQLRRATVVDFFTNQEAKQIQTALQGYDQVVVSREKEEIEGWLYRVLSGFMFIGMGVLVVVWYQKRKNRAQLQELRQQIDKITLLHEVDKEEIRDLNELLAQSKLIKQEYDEIIQLSTLQDIQALGVYLRIQQSPESYHVRTHLAALKHWLDITSENFATRLYNEYPHLSPTEINLCCLQRLGFSTERMATIMQVKVSSINQNIYRTCPKLGIENDKHKFKQHICSF